MMSFIGSSKGLAVLLLKMDHQTNRIEDQGGGGDWG